MEKVITLAVLITAFLIIAVSDTAAKIKKGKKQQDPIDVICRK